MAIGFGGGCARDCHHRAAPRAHVCGVHGIRQPALSAATAREVGARRGALALVLLERDLDKLAGSDLLLGQSLELSTGCSESRSLREPLYRIEYRRYRHDG